MNVILGDVVDGMIPVRVEVQTEAAEVAITVNGVSVAGEPTATATATGFVAEAWVPEAEHVRLHSEWRGAYGSLVVALARHSPHAVAGHFAVVGGI